MIPLAATKLVRSASWYSVLSFGSLIAVWELLGWRLQLRYLPPLSAVLARLGEMVAEGSIFGHLADSLINLTIGLSISLVVGIGLGLLMGVSPRINAALDPYVQALFIAPALIFAPIFFAIFGLGREPVIGVIVMYAIFVIIINSTAAVRSVPRDLVEMAHSYNASDLQIFRRIILPAALPLILAAVRVATGQAVKGMVTGEMFIAVVGLGGVVSSASRRFDSVTILAVLVVMVTVAFSLMTLVQRIDQRLTAWLPATARR